MMTWRDTLSLKYTDLPGVRKYHDFLFIRSHIGEIVMKVREQCYTGAWKDSPLRLLDPSICGTPTTNYKDTKYHAIKDEKMANMITMYNRFISPDRRPSYLPVFQPSYIGTQSTSTSAPTATPHQQPSSGATSRPRKPSKCSVAGCDGTGHRNKARWSEGHNTKAGCPIFHGQT